MLIFAEYFSDMNSFKKILGICLLQILVFSLSAQNHEVLKSFINKNDIAIRSVQKQAIQSGSPETDQLYKELLALQIITVNSFEQNSEKSADIAYFVRKKCISFLTTNAKTSTEYLKLNDKENSYFLNHKNYISDPSEINNIDSQKLRTLNLKDPHVFENLKTRID